MVPSLVLLIPTPRFWILVGLGIPVAFVGRWVPGFEVVLLPYNLGLLALLLISGSAARKWDGLLVRRATENILSVRVANSVTLEFSTTRAEAIRIQGQDEVPPEVVAKDRFFDLWVEPGEPTLHRYDMVPLERGETQFLGTTVRYADPLGLCWIQKVLPTEGPARIYPNVQALREFDLLNQKGQLSMMGARRSRIRGIGQEFESMREYNDDDLRFVDWKATARRNKLVVRNYETERNQAVIVCVDLGRHMLGRVGGVTKLDHTLDASLMLLRAAQIQGDLVGLLTFHESVVRYVPPKKGSLQHSILIDAMFGAHAEPVQSNYAAAFNYLSHRWKRRSLVIVFSDAENTDQASELSAALASIRRHHKLILVRVSDPRLRELRSLPLSQPRHLHQRASALWYLRDRAEAGGVLSASRIECLEAEPEHLASTLVNAYHRVKERAEIS
jgi:uncharacterized protein (DUF58 family)